MPHPDPAPVVAEIRFDEVDASAQRLLDEAPTIAVGVGDADNRRLGQAGTLPLAATIPMHLAAVKPHGWRNRRRAARLP